MLPYILLSLASFFWSLNFIIGKLIVGVIPPLTISFLRWSVPLIVYLLYAWNDIRSDWPIYRRHWKFVFLLGVTGYCLNSVTVYEAVLFTSTINTSFINAFNPVLIALTGLILYHYPITVRQMGGFLLSLAGVIWIIFKGNPALILSLDINVGDLFMLGSGIAWSLHTIWYKRYAGIFPARSLFTMMMLGGVLFNLPLALAENMVTGLQWITQINYQHIAGLLCLSIFPSVLAYRFWNQGLDKVSANRVAMFQYLIPVYTVLISLAFLDEKLQLFQLVGGGLIFAGVMLVVYK